MNQHFVETVRVEDGVPCALRYHQQRMERTLQHFFPSQAGTHVPRLASILEPSVSSEAVVKARVVYGSQGIESVEYAPYQMRDIHSLRVVHDDTIDYAYKSTDRTALNLLAAQRGDCDEVVSVRGGLVTDTSFTNIAILGDGQWLTPRTPLLCGTRRAALLEAGVLSEADITVEMLRGARCVRLFNAMIGFGEMELAGSMVRV